MRGGEGPIPLMKTEQSIYMPVTTKISRRTETRGRLCRSPGQLVVRKAVGSSKIHNEEHSYGIPTV